MIEANGTDDGRFRIHDVDRIEPSTQANLEHGDFDATSAKHRQRRKRVVLEEGQRDVATRSVDGLEGRDEFGVGSLDTIHAYALVVTDQVWRK